MKLVISNVEFPFDLGCRVMKMKYTDCPMEQLSDFWEEIQPLTFKEIAQLSNLEQRRIAILHLGLEKIVADVNPKLLSKKTIKKTTTWVDTNGELVEHTFNDTYELYEVSGSYFSEGLSGFRQMENAYYVRCKDTSTDREYLIWVDVKSVFNTNNEDDWFRVEKLKQVNAIQCIAWTIQTNVPKGNIEKIIRQGDCIMIKPKGKYKPLDSVRHLTENEYRELIVAES